MNVNSGRKEGTRKKNPLGTLKTVNSAGGAIEKFRRERKEVGRAGRIIN